MATLKIKVPEQEFEYELSNEDYAELCMANASGEVEDFLDFYKSDAHQQIESYWSVDE